MSDCRADEFCLNNRCGAQRCTQGVTRACYDGPNDTLSVGPCRSGIQYCLPGGTRWSMCYGQHLPQAETCDGEDNNCNGRVDDGITCQCRSGEKRVCYTGPASTLRVGQCRTGIQYCELSNRWGQCFGQRLPTAEVCDGKDNDCDGRADEGITCDCEAGTIRACVSDDRRTPGALRCRRGSQICQANRTWSAKCFAELGPAQQACGLEMPRGARESTPRATFNRALVGPSLFIRKPPTGRTAPQRLQAARPTIKRLAPMRLQKRPTTVQRSRGEVRSQVRKSIEKTRERLRKTQKLKLAPVRFW